MFPPTMYKSSHFPTSIPTCVVICIPIDHYSEDCNEMMVSSFALFYFALFLFCLRQDLIYLRLALNFVYSQDLCLQGAGIIACIITPGAGLIRKTYLSSGHGTTLTLLNSKQFLLPS